MIAQDFGFPQWTFVAFVVDGFQKPSISPPYPRREKIEATMTSFCSSRCANKGQRPATQDQQLP
jgi:hypothetical protein